MSIDPVPSQFNPNARSIRRRDIFVTVDTIESIVMAKVNGRLCRFDVWVYQSQLEESILGFWHYLIYAVAITKYFIFPTSIQSKLIKLE